MHVSAFLTKPSERAKNISQISMQPNKVQVSCTRTILSQVMSVYLCDSFKSGVGTIMLGLVPVRPTVCLFTMLFCFNVFSIVKKFLLTFVATSSSLKVALKSRNKI